MSLGLTLLLDSAADAADAAAAAATTPTGSAATAVGGAVDAAASNLAIEALRTFLRSPGSHRRLRTLRALAPLLLLLPLPQPPPAVDADAAAPAHAPIATRTGVAGAANGCGGATGGSGRVGGVGAAPAVELALDIIAAAAAVRACAHCVAPCGTCSLSYYGALRRPVWHVFAELLWRIASPRVARARLVVSSRGASAAKHHVGVSAWHWAARLSVGA